MKTTDYFDNDVLYRRPYLRYEWIRGILSNPIRTQVQPDGRIRYWGFVAELGKYMRVVTLEDGETVHNVFPDRRFRP